jgi:hypothetical protein
MNLRRSLDDLVGARQHRDRHVKPERLGRLEIDDQLVFGRLLNGKVSWFGPLENLIVAARRVRSSRSAA